jgi:chromosome segregation ATPase
MAQGTSPASSPGAPGPLPAVTLELHYGSARPTTHELHDVSFLLGTVPGCDLRLPGANLPSVICLISRRSSGVTLRRLAPVLPLLVNGKPITNSPLGDGDRVSIGPIELRVSVRMPDAAPREAALPSSAPVLRPHATDAEIAAREHELDELARALDAQRQQLAEKAKQLDTERAEWLQHRAELEEQYRKQPPTKSQDEWSTVQRELAELRQELSQDYQQRRDRLVAQLAALRRAARKLQARKQQIDAEAERQAALRARLDEATLDKQRLEEGCRQLETRMQTMEREQREKLADFDKRESQLGQERGALEKGQAEHQSDLVRLDRHQANLDQREKTLDARAREMDQGYEQLRRDAAELEEQAAQMDEWHTKLVAESEASTKRKEDLDAATAQMQQRAAVLEGQQAMVATLRTRLERMREEVRREEQQLAEQRAAQAAAEAELQRARQEAEDLRGEMDQQKTLRERESAQFHERQAIMEAAVARLREAQQSVVQQEEALRQREAALTARIEELEEEQAIVRAREDQIAALQARATADRDAIAQRETALAQAEQTLAALQEQLRRRADELTTRQRAQAEHTRHYEETLAGLEARRLEIERERQQAEERAVEARKELDARQAEVERRATELEQTRRELVKREETLLRSIERLKEAGRTVGKGRKELTQERVRTEADKQRVVAALTQAHRDFEAARDEVIDLQRQLPELELQAREAAQRLAQAREQLRNHLAEVHSYTRQSREDLEQVRAQVRAEAERVRQQEAALHRDRDEHRLAVAAFRQQLIDWQGHVEELKRTLAHGETRLERRRAEMDAQVRAVDATSQRLARQAEELQQQEKLVTERRGEVERHLEDMRQWYRHKLRELAGIRDETGDNNLQTAVDHPEDQRNILSLTGDVTPADRQLGDLLRSLELVDADTLTALLVEARRQRRSLRQLLLAGSHLTLYQMALIEAGNLDGLVLGPLRVVDRLRATPAETVYRVFDPRRNQEALLRHLSEEEMQDAVRPDEFRQRFSAAASVRHPHLAATFEVLEIAGRPAVLQEWLKGLPSCDWPVFATAPGVWYRLVNQAFLGLHTAHHAGLVHGGLDASRIVLTSDGLLKLSGFGEPAWLADAPSGQTANPDAPADVAALGRLAAGWATPDAQAKKPRAKPFPSALQTLLDRLSATDPALSYASAAAVLEELDRAGTEVPANAAAWERFVRQVRDQSVDAALRFSA